MTVLIPSFASPGKEIYLSPLLFEYTLVFPSMQVSCVWLNYFMVLVTLEEELDYNNNNNIMLERKTFKKEALSNPGKKLFEK